MDCLIKFVIRLNILKVKKSGITNSINHNFGNIRIHSYNSLPIKKCWLFIMLWYPLNQFLIKINTTVCLEKVSDKDRWMFVYYKCYIMIELTFLKELMLIKQVHQKSVIFVFHGIF